MKNFKKILVVVLVCATLFAGCMVAAFANDEYTGTLEEFTALVETAEKASTDIAAGDAVVAMSAYLKNNPVDPSTEGYGDIIDRADAAIVRAANLLLAKIDKNIETTLKTAQNKVAINRLKRVLDGCELKGDKASLTDVWGVYTNLVKAHDNAVAANLAALDDINSIEDYDLPIYLDYDEDAHPVKHVSKDEGIGEFSFAVKSTSNKLGIGQEANGNKYMYSSYSPTDQTDKNTYFQLALASYPADNGYVFEFDLSTLDSIPEKSVNIEAGGFDMHDGRGFPAYYLTVDPDGSLRVGTAPNSEYGNPKVVLEKAIVPGQWLRVAIIFNKADFTYTLVVEGEELATYTAEYKNTTFDLSKGVIRFGSASTSGSIAVDDFVLYSGSNYRNPNKFNNMTDDEKFVYYANYLLDDSRNVNGRNVAYTMAGELLYKYWDVAKSDYTDYAKNSEELKAAVDAYNGFDFEELLIVVKNKNLQEYIAKVTALNDAKRSVDTATSRQTLVLDIEKFATDYAELINKAADNNENGEADYYEYNKIVETVKQEIEYDKNAILFIRYMARFEMVSTIVAMQRYYDNARDLVLENAIDISLATNPDHEDRANFEEYIAAYETYLASYEILDGAIKKDNSAKIVSCMDFIKVYTTEEEWMENYDVMNKYINIVKDSILKTDENGNPLYDPTYDGVAERVEFFNIIYAFFYNVHQEMHIEYISGILDLISDTEAYVEKMGMVSMIDRYVATNDLDYSDQTIISLLNSLETVRSELQVREEDYGKILIQNSVYFVNLVENMRTAETYSQKKNYFEQASLLYFNIDITVQGTANAVAIYDTYAIDLAIIEESSIAFLEAVDYYNACETPDDRYAALVDCYYNAQFAEPSYAGVEEAMAEFENEYNTYMDYAETVNEEIVAAGNIVGSLRTNCGITPIIAIIIKKIFGI